MEIHELEKPKRVAIMAKSKSLVVVAVVVLVLLTVGLSLNKASAGGNPFDLILGKLDQIINLLGGGTGEPDKAFIPKTGQTVSYATADDGDLEKGLQWPNPRFIDNIDGTVTDNLTGLVWLENANRFGFRSWNNALNDCNCLEDDGTALTDGSQAGDWRLPNRKELLSLIHFGYTTPALPDTAGTGQMVEDDPFSNLAYTNYWTSTSEIGFGGSQAFFVDSRSG